MRIHTAVCRGGQSQGLHHSIFLQRKEREDEVTPKTYRQIIWVGVPAMEIDSKDLLLLLIELRLRPQS